MLLLSSSLFPPASLPNSHRPPTIDELKSERAARGAHDSGSAPDSGGGASDNGDGNKAHSALEEVPSTLPTSPASSTVFVLPASPASSASSASPATSVVAVVLEGLLELTCQQDPAACDAAVSAGAFATLADALHNHTDHLRVVKVAAVVLMRLTYQHVQHSQLALDAGCGDGLRVARRRLESMQASMQGGARSKAKLAALSDVREVSTMVEISEMWLNEVASMLC